MIVDQLRKTRLVLDPALILVNIGIILSRNFSFSRVDMISLNLHSTNDKANELGQIGVVHYKIRSYSSFCRKRGKDTEYLVCQ
jgi:hypothetical protein